MRKLFLALTALAVAAAIEMPQPVFAQAQFDDPCRPTEKTTGFAGSPCASRAPGACLASIAGGAQRAAFAQRAASDPAGAQRTAPDPASAHAADPADAERDTANADHPQRDPADAADHPQRDAPDHAGNAQRNAPDDSDNAHHHPGSA